MKTRHSESQVPNLASQPAGQGPQRVEAGPGWELHLGDCIAGMRELPDDAVDVVITDPPYSQHTHAKEWTAYALNERAGRRFKNPAKSINFEHITETQIASVVEECARVSRRWSLFFCDVESAHLWRSPSLEYVRTCFWTKPDSAPQFSGDRPGACVEAIVVLHRSGRKRWNGGGRRNVFTDSVNDFGRNDRPHPTTKPLSLMRELVSLFSDPDELILDPFAGSGSTGVACRQLGRRFLGWELNPDYFDIACRRLRGERAKPIENQPELF